MRLFLFSLFTLTVSFCKAQDLYFPPLEGDEWQNKPITELNWCPEKVDSLYSFLEEKNSRGFIVLHQGEIVLEQYFNGADQAAPWYWASAGKTLSSFLIGCAQSDGLVDINAPVSNYLGEGWTSTPPEKEELITVRDQLTMTSGLNYEGVDLNCLEPACLTYDADAGEQWFYHNAPYRLTLDVLANVYEEPINLATFNRVGERIGMGGLWIDRVRWSKARDMARFGLLVAADGVWDGDVILDDLEYINAMRTPSQTLNPAYGYLWWLNGQEELIYPTFDSPIPFELIETAPDDLYAALGKDDQKIYIVPSMDLVVVRQGEAAEEVALGPSSFDAQLWEHIMNLECEVSVGEVEEDAEFKVYPNPARDIVWFSEPLIGNWAVSNVQGKELMQVKDGSKSVSVEELPQGFYFMRAEDGRSIRLLKI